ncbi:hypothetical protein CEXT_411191 [Caerostris extrusa]|uniref:Uncharacterized protein n=1 Tax=Caerostris extrusa TaxID=172846 RepID=A0AAV4XRG3_CAEEX|nr:hypothetical protein CEXT_411191 [Caerostris extrusa]
MIEHKGTEGSDNTVPSSGNIISFTVGSWNVEGKSKELQKICVEFKGKQKLFNKEEISAMVLTKMRETAEMYLGEKVTDAVIMCRLTSMTQKQV